MLRKCEVHATPFISASTSYLQYECVIEMRTEMHFLYMQFIGFCICKYCVVTSLYSRVYFSPLFSRFFFHFSHVHYTHVWQSASFLSLSHFFISLVSYIESSLSITLFFTHSLTPSLFSPPSPYSFLHSSPTHASLSFFLAPFPILPPLVLSRTPRPCSSPPPSLLFRSFP